MEIEPARESDFDELTTVWEGSVRATHGFLPEEYLEVLRPMVRSEFLPAVQVFCIRDERGKIAGFSGISGDKMEMLFIRPDRRGQGIGRQLLEHALAVLKVTRVDVNEQNQQAVGFYRHFDFQVIGRSPRDAMDRPYPILHLELDGR